MGSFGLTLCRNSTGKDDHGLDEFRVGQSEEALAGPGDLGGLGQQMMLLLPSMWETQMQFPAAGSSPAQPWMLWAIEK